MTARRGSPRSPLTAIAVVCALVMIVGAGGWVAVRAAAGWWNAGDAACHGIGHPSGEPIEAVWTTIEAQGDTTTVAYQVSQPLDVPVAGRGLRVDAVVFGTRNAPIFPDPVVLAIVGDAHLAEALHRDALERTASSPPSAQVVTSSVASPDAAAQLRTVGAGLKGIDEDVPLPPGTYRLVTADARAELGPVAIRICR